MCDPAQNPEIGEQVVQGYGGQKRRRRHLQNLRHKIPMFNMASALHVGRYAKGSQAHEVRILSRIFEKANMPGMTDETALWDNPEAKKFHHLLEIFQTKLVKKLDKIERLLKV